MFEMERTEWSDLRQDNSNNIEAPDISDSDYTDFPLRMRNMANVSQRRNAHGNNRDENGAMGNGGEPVRTPEKWGDPGKSKGGSDGYETEKAGMVRTRQKKRWNWKHPISCRNDDGGEAL